MLLVVEPAAQRMNDCHGHGLAGRRLRTSGADIASQHARQKLVQAHAFLRSVPLKPRVQAARPQRGLETASGGRRVL